MWALCGTGRACLEGPVRHSGAVRSPVSRACGHATRRSLAMATPPQQARRLRARFGHAQVRPDVPHHAARQHAAWFDLDACGDEESPLARLQPDTKSAQRPVAQDAPIHSRAAAEQGFAQHYNRHPFFRTKPGQNWRKRAARPGLASLHSHPLARHRSGTPTTPALGSMVHRGLISKEFS